MAAVVGRSESEL